MLTLFSVVISESTRISTKVNLFRTGLPQNLFFFLSALVFRMCVCLWFCICKSKSEASHGQWTHDDKENTRNLLCILTFDRFCIWFEHKTHFSSCQGQSCRHTVGTIGNYLLHPTINESIRNFYFTRIFAEQRLPIGSAFLTVIYENR